MRRVLQTAHRLVGATRGDATTRKGGTTRIERAWVADPELIRRLETGQACYIHRGAANFVQVARPVLSPLSLPVARPSVVLPPPRREPEPGPPPSLDDVLGSPVS